MVTDDTTLSHFLGRARELVPTAVDGTSYGMPALLYRGRPLVAMVTTASGYSVYPFSPAVIDAVALTHPDLTRSKGAVTFTETHTLSTTAFDALIRGRVAEIDLALETSGRRKRDRE
ncbi:DUF1801 domain-containing protein [Microcella sp.]|uniref:DUF1801 domain-containing protein n=1 Tax=Microcella sp. TaxID=1913979 RepID=UPI00391C49A8